MALWTLYKREVSAFFLSPVAYVVMTLSALMLGLSFAAVLNFMLSFDVRHQSVLYIITTNFALLWLIVQVPIITMRVFAEEYKMGTIEMLLTAPVREWDIVLAKYFGVLTFLFVLWLPLFLNMVLLNVFTTGQTPAFSREAGLTYLILFLIGAFFTAIGLLCSALTRNQIVAALLSFMTIILFFILSAFRYNTLGTDDFFTYTLSLINPATHLSSFGRGVFDSRSLIYFASCITFLLFLTQRTLIARKLST